MRLHGVKLPHKKNTADSVPQPIPLPETVFIPMSMHIGKNAVPIVKAGDKVKVNFTGNNAILFDRKTGEFLTLGSIKVE